MKTFNLDVSITATYFGTLTVKADDAEGAEARVQEILYEQGADRIFAQFELLEDDMSIDKVAPAQDGKEETFPREKEKAKKKKKKPV